VTGIAGLRAARRRGTDPRPTRVPPRHYSLGTTAVAGAAPCESTRSPRARNAKRRNRFNSLGGRSRRQSLSGSDIVNSPILRRNRLALPRRQHLPWPNAARWRRGGNDGV
jgi:hypothetical protein